jgi:hypothetical protein
MDLDRAKHEEEKVKLLEKMFSCAETPIKEWLAEIKNVDVEEMFPDFVDENDVFGFNMDNKHYNVYLVSMESNKTFIDPEILKNEDAKKACEFVFNAVIMVYEKIIENLPEMKCFGCKFNDELMAFELFRYNMAYLQFNKYIRNIMYYEDLIKNMKEEGKTDTIEILEKELEKCKLLYENFDRSEIDKEVNICKEENNKKKSLLHIVLDEDFDNEYSYNRLFTVGQPYHDPDEETFIDKLKKNN